MRRIRSSFPIFISRPSMVVILNGDDGKIITTLPVGDEVDTRAFNPSTMEAIGADGAGTMTFIRENSPTSLVVEQTLKTLPGAKTMVPDTKTNHVFPMTAEFGPPPRPPPGGCRGGRPAAIPDSFTRLEIGRS